MSKAGDMLDMLDMLGESEKYGPKLNQWIKSGGLEFNFKKLNGTLEAGLEIDVQFKKDGALYRYWGRDEFQATKGGKPVDSSEFDELVSDLVSQDYPKALGAPKSVIKALVDLEGWEYKDGVLVETE